MLWCTVEEHEELLALRPAGDALIRNLKGLLKDVAFVFVFPTPAVTSTMLVLSKQKFKNIY